MKQPTRTHATAKVIFAAMVAVLAAHAYAQTGPHFIHGSWVNVRESADAGSRATDQLVTNTPVQVQARQGNWCQLIYGSGKSGFVSCSLLGPNPLTLLNTTKEPARAFWVAPSPNRLAAYGQSIIPPTNLRLETLKKTLQEGDVVRYPAMAEFEAAKKLMKAGVELNPLHEIKRGPAVDMAVELKAYKLKPSPIRPSLFRTHESVALVSETDADGLAAVAGAKVSVQPAGLPKGWTARHNGPEIEGITGFWDVGSATLHFSAPLVIYSIAANGLVGAAAVQKLPFDVGGEGHYCGAHYLSKSVTELDALHMDWKPENVEYALVKAYPTIKNGTEVLARFAVTTPFNRQSAKIKTQSQPVSNLPNNAAEDGKDKTKELKPNVILREIDLDGDGVADVMQIERPIRFGEISVDIVLHRSWYININGQWFNAGEWEDEDCT